MFLRIFGFFLFCGALHASLGSFSVQHSSGEVADEGCHTVILQKVRRSGVEKLLRFKTVDEGIDDRFKRLSHAELQTVFNDRSLKDFCSEHDVMTITLCAEDGTHNDFFLHRLGRHPQVGVFLGNNTGSVARSLSFYEVARVAFLRSVFRDCGGCVYYKPFFSAELALLLQGFFEYYARDERIQKFCPGDFDVERELSRCWFVHAAHHALAAGSIRILIGSIALDGIFSDDQVCADSCLESDSAFFRMTHQLQKMTQEEWSAWV